MSGASKIERCLRLYRSFLKRGRLTVADACRINRTDRQKARRDLESLVAAGLPIEVRGDGADRSFVLLEEHRDTGLVVSTGDLVALHMGRQLMSFVEGTDLTTWLDELDQKLEPSKPPSTRALEARVAARLVFHSEPYRSYAATDEVLDEVLTALLGEKLLALEYRSRSGPRSWDRVEPLALVVYRRALYLLARLSWSDLVLRLPVERIASARNTRVPFRYPADFDVRAELDRNFGIFDSGEPVAPVRIRFAPHAADLVEARTWHPTASVTREADGSVVLELRAAGRELVRLVTEWGSAAEVLDPPWLREAVIAELRGALARYGEIGPDT